MIIQLVAFMAAYGFVVWGFYRFLLPQRYPVAPRHQFILKWIAAIASLGGAVTFVILNMALSFAGIAMPDPNESIESIAFFFLTASILSVVVPWTAYLFAEQGKINMLAAYAFVILGGFIPLLWIGIQFLNL